MAPLTPEQLLEHREFIGGTGAAALAGVNPPNWSQPIDVYLEMTGQAPPRKPSTMMSMGHLMEPLVAALFTEATGIGLRRHTRAVRSRRYPWAGGHLDRFAADGSVFEAKWGMRADEWGPSWRRDERPGDEADVLWPPDEGTRAPLRYVVQVQHYLAVTERGRAYLAVLLGYGDFRWYVVPRDEAMIATLMEIEERFMREHVVPRVPPEPDGSEGYTRHLRRLHPDDDGTEAVATPEQQAMAAQLRDLLREQAALARHVEVARQRLMTSMATTSKLVGPDFTITYRRNKPTTKVEWEALATEQLRLHYEDQGQQWPATKKAQAEAVRAVAASWGLATTEEGARPFKPTFTSDEE